MRPIQRELRSRLRPREPRPAPDFRGPGFRVVTTAIALEAAKGSLPLPIALGLVLLSSVLVLNALAYGPRQWAVRSYG